MRRYRESGLGSAVSWLARSTATVSSPRRCSAALRSELSRAATAALGTDEVDLVVLNDAPPLFKHRAMSGAVRLVERDPVNRVRLETAALLEYFDTAPLRKALSTARRRRIAEGRFGRR